MRVPDLVAHDPVVLVVETEGCEERMIGTAFVVDARSESCPDVTHGLTEPTLHVYTPDVIIAAVDRRTRRDEFRVGRPRVVGGDLRVEGCDVLVDQLGGLSRVYPFFERWSASP